MALFSKSKAAAVAPSPTEVASAAREEDTALRLHFQEEMRNRIDKAIRPFIEEHFPGATNIEVDCAYPNAIEPRADLKDSEFTPEFSIELEHGRAPVLLKGAGRFDHVSRWTPKKLREFTENDIGDFHFKCTVGDKKVGTVCYVSLHDYGWKYSDPNTGNVMAPNSMDRSFQGRHTPGYEYWTYSKGNHLEDGSKTTKVEFLNSLEQAIEKELKTNPPCPVLSNQEDLKAPAATVGRDDSPSPSVGD